MKKLLLLPLLLAADWATYRADPQRSGGDGKPGPVAAPKVLWAFKAKEHFVAAPVPAGGRVYASGLGFVNTPTFYCLDAKGAAAWSKTAPLIELPTVSSPALVKGTLVFGEGMHQTNGASLYGMAAADGKLLWQLKIEGDLVHLEGSPTVADGLVYLGGGAAGVLCVDPSKLTLDGKAMSAAEIAKAIDAKRADLQKKYEEAKARKDPFAVPPTDRDLPRAAPAIAWQVGKGKWHVDAPLAVVGGKVLVASAYLDKEKIGSRAVYCLDAKTGKELWSADLAVNPWGGPSVQGGTVVVTGSSIGYDPAALAGAKGIVAAFSLADGKPKWRKALDGGVVSCAALAKDLAIVTCTDGKVRAYALDKGALRWTANTGAPFFAPPAVAGETAYVADLKGVVHALALKGGASRWKHEIESPGMVYAGPSLHEGRLYVATCNIAGDHSGKPTVVVCLGEKRP
ncbi:MAG: PQQ-binding-like beta-propeller repeat protein [Gemmataceae bacterium]|nr:PQQ-binding-like beta-propeller repeat protein [Gemmataceae bacterium]